MAFEFVYLGGAGVMLAGLLAFPGRPRSRQEQVRLALDIGVVVAAAFVVVWYLVLGPATMMEDPGWLTVFLSVAYPVADLVLVFGIVTAMLRGAPPSSTGSLQLLLLGIGAYVIADVADGYMSLHGGDAVDIRWTHLLWLGGLLLFAVAADGQWAHSTGEEAAERPARPRRPFSVLPYLAVAGGYGLLLAVARGLAQRPLAAVMIDVVHFKQINDRYGHAAGDAVLREVAERCRRLLRTSDLVGRYGGDELVVLLPETGADGAAGVAARIRDAVTGAPVQAGTADLALTLSLGVADSGGCRGLDALLHRADMALYEAKRRGRDRAAVWSAAAAR